MTARDIRDILPLYITGTLDADERKLVEEALTTSDELRKEAAFWEGAREILSAHARFAGAGHLSPSVLVDRASGRLTGDILLAADHHLQSCPDCSDLLHRIENSPGVRDASPISAPAGARRRLPKSRLAYGLAVAAGIAAIVFSLVGDQRKEPSPSLASETPPSTAPDTAAATERKFTLVLAYRPLVRSTEPARIPAFALGGKNQRVTVVLAIPRNAAKEIRYTISAEYESAQPLLIEQQLRPFGYGTTYDSLRVVVSRVVLPPPGKTVTFVVREILTPELSDLTPEEYRFDVMVQEKTPSP